MEPLPPHLQAIHDRVSDDPPRSKLAAFAPLILRWRRRGKTFQRIAALLQQECDLRVSAEGVRKFVKAQSRKRTTAPITEETPVAAQNTTSQTSPPRPAKEDFAEMRKRIQELRNAPPPPPKENKKSFVFDESKPIAKGPL